MSNNVQSSDLHSGYSMPDEKSLCKVLDDFGIATLGSCRELEPGFLQIEFPSAEDAEEFLTPLLVGMSDQDIQGANDLLYARMMGGSGDGRPWKYDAFPMDFRDLLDPEEIDRRPIFPYAVALKVSLSFPVEDYNRILELIAGCPRTSRYGLK